MINPKMRDEVARRIEMQNHLVKKVKERYAACVPQKTTKSHVPRIHPQEREARQVRAVEEKRRRSDSTFRVCRTPLDDDWVDQETGEILAEASANVVRMPIFRKEKEPEPLPFEVNWNRPRDEE